MALTKSKSTNKRRIIKVLVGALLVASVAITGVVLQKNKELETELKSNNNKIVKLETKVKSLTSEKESLEEDLSYEINSESDIRIIRDDLIEAINKIVKDRNRNIEDIDILRALNSTENRIMDEYIRIAALILATMEIESNFKYINCTNNNGTVDHGIMQVNDAIIPHIKEALGDHIDPINSKDDNVEAGSWEIYECYLRAKDKHPEDVIWWTYAYYNRGMYFESTDAWKNPKNPNYKAVHEQANARSNKFKESYNAYYEALCKAID